MKKIFSQLMIVGLLLTLFKSTAYAQEAAISGTVQSAQILTDAAGLQTVEVALTDANGAALVVVIDLQTAETLGLIMIDPATLTPVLLETISGMPVEIPSGAAIPPADPEEETETHPVGSALSEFFSDLLGVDYDTIMTAREEGVGFGVIAQALWLTHSISGGTEEFTSLIEAKKDNDYSSITLSDGSTPNNWGDVVKSLKKGDNLGSVMSESTEGTDPSSQPENGKPNNNPPGQEKPKNQNNGQGNGGGNGGGNGNGNGHNKP